MPYWWELLEEAIAQYSLTHVGNALALRAGTPLELADGCKAAGLTARISELFGGYRTRHLERGDVELLVHAGMDIGFHTLQHPVLTDLTRERVDDALRVGRQELEAATGRRLERFAYPHGHYNSEVATRVRLAGFQAAWTASGRPMSPGNDPFQLGRWDPGLLAVDDFLPAVALRLTRPSADPTNPRAAVASD